MGNAEARGDAPRVVDVLPGAARAGAMRGGAVIVELQRHADGVVAGMLHQRRGDGGIDAARHRDDDAGSVAPAWQIKIDVDHQELLRSGAYRRTYAFPRRQGQFPSQILREFNTLA